MLGPARLNEEMAMLLTTLTATLMSLVLFTTAHAGDYQVG